MENPTKSILNPLFHYVPSHSTDLRRTFERIRHERELSECRPAPAVTRIKNTPERTQ